MTKLKGGAKPGVLEVNMLTCLWCDLLTHKATYGWCKEHQKKISRPATTKKCSKWRMAL